METQETWTGDDLAAWRKRLGWTQTKASEQLGVTLRGYQKREAGEVPLLRETMLACRFLELDNQPLKAEKNRV